MHLFFWRKKIKKKKSLKAAKRPRVVLITTRKRRAKKAFWERLAVSRSSLATGVSGVLIFILLLYTAQVSGLKSDLYPTVCDGGWQKAEMASGEPDFAAGEDPDLFTRKNSAVFSGGVEHIICRGFDRGDVNDTAKISGAQVRFSLVVKRNAMENSQAEVPAQENQSGQDGEQGMETVDGGQASDQSDIELITDPAAIQELQDAAAEPSGEPAPSTESDVAPAEGPSDDAPSSDSGSDSSAGDSQASEWRFIQRANAQEADPVAESPAPDEAPAPAESSVPDQVSPADAEENSVVDAPVDTPVDVDPASSGSSTEQVVQPESAGDAAESEPVIVIEPVSPEAQLATISYSFDGTTWYVLGRVTEDNADALEFTLPLSEAADSINADPVPASEVSSSGGEDAPYVHGPAIANWQDIEALQFKVEGSIFSLEDILVIYLDGVHLHIEYEEGELEILTQGEVDALPHFEVPAVEIFGETQKDFRVDEEPSFAIILKSHGEVVNEATQSGAVSEPLSSDADIAPVDTVTADEKIPETADKETPTGTEAPTQQSEGGSVIDAGKSEPAIPAEEAIQEPETSQQTPSLFGVRTARAQTPPQQIVWLKVLKAEVYGPDGGLTDIEPLIGGEEDALKINVPKSVGFFRPGTYQLKVEILSDEQVFMTTQSFTWGALVLNTDQALYVSGDRAYLQMAALDDSGHALCDADLLLKIENPSGEISSYQLSDGGIAKSGMCKPDSVTSEPDYFMHYTVGEPGIYVLRLMNQATGSEVTDTLTVTKELPVEIERIGATRIYPFEAYEMSIRVKANEDISGVVYERVPSNFTIAETFGDVALKDNGYIIAFGLNLAKGEVQTLRYTYNVPDVSPRSYEMGPLAFEFSTKEEVGDAAVAALAAAEGDATGEVAAPAENGDEVVPLSSGFAESRQWKLISDASDVASIQIMDPLALRLLQEQLEREMGRSVVVSQQPQFGDWTVFRMEKDGHIDIFLKNEATGEVSAITDTPEPESEAVISGDFVGWVGLRIVDGTSQGEAFVYSLKDGTTKQVTSDTFVDQLPQFAGSILIWQKVDVEGRSHSFRYDVMRKTSSKIGDEPFTYVHVQLPSASMDNASSGVSVPQN